MTDAAMFFAIMALIGAMVGIIGFVTAKEAEFHLEGQRALKEDWRAKALWDANRVEECRLEITALRTKLLFAEGKLGDVP